MGQDAGFDFDEICEIGRCPKTALPPRHSERRSGARRSRRRDDLLVLNDKFFEINFGKYRSVSCKSVPDRPKGMDGGLEMNRGSVYESSTEVGRTRNLKKFERRKIELPRGSDTSSCLSIVDSLCSSDDEVESNRSSVISRSSRVTMASKCDCSSVPSSAGGSRQNCETLDNMDRGSSESIRSFSKSFSVKVERPPSSFVSESRRSSQSSLRTRFSPVKMMLDPLVKSKSSRSPLSHTIEDPAVVTNATPLTAHGKLAKDSAVQLHGILNRKQKHGVPSFEFLLECPEEALVAETWKQNNVFDSVYTFHSVDNRKKTFAEGKGSEDCRKESLVVGQMQVGCHISSELRSDGNFHDSTVIEFVLYDTAHVMQSTPQSPSRTSPGSVGRTNRVDDISSAMKLWHGLKRNVMGRDRPLASTELGPELEIAAVVVQIPCEKRESLRNPSAAEQRNIDKDMVNVVVPAGSHGLPNTEGSGPSPLLERWRAGGGCDCSGWDMGCPLVVLGNPSINIEDQILVQEDKPLRLLLQGTKDRIPALTMKFLREGFYEISFHARLSSLQAFSICIAMLHSVEATKASRDDDERNPGHGNSLELLVKEDSQFLVGPIRKIVNATPSYVVHPPFSPIARV
ncbi:hypothetical protein MLD38_018457 [Melastoma candidum]|uniref:Uncharacterized protein n=1 Tax=Melastoma candidum TaxID=119954 RepID=A0ACB9R249_9MYRT|nr:hypothetical protein MLD38_018457 [Melastoma candidum]